MENTGQESLSRLADWLLNRMADYHGGGVPYTLAARWTYGELLAAYKGLHYRNGKRTKPPDIPAEKALKQAEAWIRELKGAYKEIGKEI